MLADFIEDTAICWKNIKRKVDPTGRYINICINTGFILTSFLLLQEGLHNVSTQKDRPLLEVFRDTMSPFSTTAVIASVFYTMLILNCVEKAYYDVNAALPELEEIEDVQPLNNRQREEDRTR
ncbi:hypothetical protein [Candidatus Mesenet endosymbiont of Agriotes lineatus]|uniref:hypothetical protein n=1 Tax=Candidatus Mesenet endosymbiont of Agriotes lineatus TaxID=3077948 RepID=UPI0030CCA9C8